MTSREREIMALLRHIRPLFLHAQIGSKLIFTNELQTMLLTNQRDSLGVKGVLKFILMVLYNHVIFIVSVKWVLDTNEIACLLK